MNQKALENCNDNCNAEKKAIVFLVTVVATCLHAEDAKNVPHTCTNASWSFWQSWIWTWLDVSQRLGATGADSGESAKSCLAYEDSCFANSCFCSLSSCQPLSEIGFSSPMGDTCPHCVRGRGLGFLRYLQPSRFVALRKCGCLPQLLWP